MTLSNGLRARCASLSALLFLFATTPSPAAQAAPGPHSNALVGGGPTQPALLPTGQFVTPLAAPGSSYTPLSTGLRPDTNADANGAVTTALSPDGKTLLVLTSGYNTGFYPTNATSLSQFFTTPYIDAKTGLNSKNTTGQFQWVFVFDVSSGALNKQQQIQLPNAYDGLAWDPSGTRFYVSGGQDDRVYIFKATSAGWKIDAPLPVLGHNTIDAAAGPGFDYDGGILKFTKAGSSALVRSLGLNFGPMTAGVNVTDDGKQLIAANLQNDSISIVDTATRAAREIKLFHPGSRAAFGEFPYWVQPHSAIAGGPADKYYITSLRDGQIIAISTSGRAQTITVGGEPAKMILTRDERFLLVANPDLDEIEVVDTSTDTLRERISVARPGYRYRGSIPNSLALSPNGHILYVTLAGENAVGVIDLSSGSVIGRIPTGWYPSSVTPSADGTKLFVAIPKSNSGPAPTLKGSYLPPAYPNPTALDQYVYADEKAGIETIPVPDAQTLGYLSALVNANDNFAAQGRSPMMQFLHRHIKHVIYIEKENRTYDQVLGDLPEGNGDPRLVEFPTAVSPNHHALALRFGDLDNWYMAGDVSGDGWNWWAQGHANDYTNKSVPVSYAGGGFDFEWNGEVRNTNLAAPIFGGASWYGERMTTVADPSGSSTIQPGPKDIAATVGADDERPGQTGGYIWDTVLRAGLTHRHYGLYVDQTFYSGLTNPFNVPIDRHAYEHHVVQASPVRLALVGRTDPYYRGWDLNEPDEYRYEEWKREFDGYVKTGDLPSLEVLTVMNDHFGNNETNVGGLKTPTLQMASNDHSVGLIVDAVSHSKYWKDTAIFIAEDDSQDGPDHVDSHRSPGFVISPYSRQGVIHTFYSHPSMVRTIEDILGTDYLGMNDANAYAMDDAFTPYANYQPYDAIIPGNLCQSPVVPDLVPACYSPFAKKTQAVPMVRNLQWWHVHARKLVFSAPDTDNANEMNRIVWSGTVGDVPYPESRTGEDLGADREHVLATYEVPVPLH
jgi:YVTN family beta-propeller protein